MQYMYVYCMYVAENNTWQIVSASTLLVLKSSFSEMGRLRLFYRGDRVSKKTKTIQKGEKGSEEY